MCFGYSCYQGWEKNKDASFSHGALGSHFASYSLFLLKKQKLIFHFCNGNGKILQGGKL